MGCLEPDCEEELPKVLMFEDALWKQTEEGLEEVKHHWKVVETDRREDQHDY